MESQQHPASGPEQVTAVFTVFFEDPFWVGLYERTENGKTSVSRMVFGAEPRDGEVYERLLREWPCLRFSPPVSSGKDAQKRLNPKRMQREIRARLARPAIGTKAQQALQLQQEENKLERVVTHREKNAEEKDLRFELRQKQKKQRHRGR